MTTVSVGMALVFVASAFYTCGQAGRQGGAGAGGGANGAATNAAAAEATVATIAGKPVTVGQIEGAIQAQMAQMGQMAGMGLSADQEATFASYAVSNALRTAAVEAIAAKNGVQVTDDAIRRVVDKQFQNAVEQARAQLITEKKIKPNATDAELDAAVKKQFGKTLAELKAEQTKQLTDALKDPEKRTQVVAALTPILLREQIASKLAPSDDELRANYDQLTVKRIVFKADANKNAQAEAQRVLAEIRGGLKFEDAMNRYSKEPPLPNKRVSENTISVSGGQFTEDAYRPLAGRKAGDLAGPVDIPEGTVLYKVVSVRNQAPEDFEKNKAKYRQQLAEGRADAEVKKLVDETIKGPDLKWSSPAYQALYQLGAQNATTDPAARQKELEAVAARAEGVLNTAQGPERKAAALAVLGSLQQLTALPGANAQALGARRVAAMEAVLEMSEDPSLRAQLVDAYAQQKDKVKTGEALLRAVQYNSDYTPVGQSQYAALQSKLSQFKKEGLVTAEVEAQIQKEFTRWRTEKVRYEKEQAEARKREAEAAKAKSPATPPTKGGSDFAPKGP